MFHQLPWNDDVLQTFILEAKLSVIEIKVMITRIDGWTQEKQRKAFKIKKNELSDMIKSLKLKYDEVQKNNPSLPKRRKSAAETFMDECPKAAQWNDCDLSATNLRYLISEWIFDEKRRNILVRKMIDGVTFEALAEEFEMSERQIKNIVSESRAILQKHTKSKLP